MQPMKMQPVLKERVWGGRRLADLLGKSLPRGTRIGESWELADHPNGRSVVADGPLAGKTLRWVLERHGEDIVGADEFSCGSAARFPILIKFIDASDKLSVQVHPDDSYAGQRHPGEKGKTECWVVIHAEPDSWLVHGLKAGVARTELAHALKRGRVEELLSVRAVRPGDFIWVPPGTVHAIGPGIVLAEVQQNSDVTYRVFDWNRAGLDGRPRDLHVDDALNTIRFGGDVALPGGRGIVRAEPGILIEHLVDCGTFSLTRLRLSGRSWIGRLEGAWAAVVVLAGKGGLETGDGSTALAPGDTILVPASLGSYTLASVVELVALVAAPPGRAPLR